jgi:hypothetical protein
MLINKITFIYITLTSLLVWTMFILQEAVLTYNTVFCTKEIVYISYLFIT